MYINLPLVASSLSVEQPLPQRAFARPSLSGERPPGISFRHHSPLIYPNVTRICDVSVAVPMTQQFELFIAPSVRRCERLLNPPLSDCLSSPSNRPFNPISTNFDLFYLFCWMFNFISNDFVETFSNPKWNVISIWMWIVRTGGEGGWGWGVRDEMKWDVYGKRPMNSWKNVWSLKFITISVCWKIMLLLSCFVNLINRC